jgi:hypothetical protein
MGGSKYKPSACIQDAVDEHWTHAHDDKRVAKSAPGVVEFLSSMRRLQADMIRCHMEFMSDEDRERAVQTLEWLDTDDSFLFDQPVR